MALYPFPGPVPAFNNPPIEPQFYQPSVFFISSIGLGQITTVTTTENVNYVIGQNVRLLIPNGFGSRQLNEQTGLVLSIPAPNQVILNINSSKADPFINANLSTKAQIVAIGDTSSGGGSTTGTVNATTYIPGAFINISPFAGQQ